MRNRSRIAAKLAGALGVLGLMAAILGLAPSANAAEVDFEYILQDGSEVTVGTTVLPLFDAANPTSAGLIGLIDDTTGDFEADLQIPLISTTQDVPDPPLPGTIELDIAITADPVVGNVDPVTNVVEASTLVDVTFTFKRLVPTSGTPPELILNVDCTMADIPMELSSEPDGENFDPNANPTTFAVADDGFEFPLPTCAWNGQGTDPTQAVVDLVEDGLVANLELPNDNTTAFLDFVAGSVTPPPPPTTTTTLPPATTATTVAPATAPATAVQAQPRVTG